MPKEGSTNAEFIFPKTRKHYVWFSIFYGLCAGSNIWSTFTTPRFQTSIWPSQIWIEVAVSAFCVWFFYQLLSELSNHLEKLICLLSMIVFALAIPVYLHELGYSWAHVWGGRRISTFIMTIAALLMFLRTFQVFRHSET